MNENFEIEKKENIKKLGKDDDVKSISKKWIEKVSKYNYSYNFTWMDRPIIQFPQDIIALQEIVWKIKPDLIIETGIARGGSLIFSASMLELIGNNGTVIGIDVDIRKHNKIEIEKHPMYKRIVLMEGSSIELAIIQKIRKFIKEKSKVMVILDSNHTHKHVLKELKLYSSFVTKGSYLVIFDTIIEDLPDDFFPNRPWGKGNNPKTAVKEFLKNTNRFVVDKDIENKLQITVAPDGYLKCIKD